MDELDDRLLKDAKILNFADLQTIGGIDTGNRIEDLLSAFRFGIHHAWFTFKKPYYEQGKFDGAKEERERIWATIEAEVNYYGKGFMDE